MDMESGPWSREQWFGSPLNFLPEIRQGLQLPRTVRFHDATLRDGEQTPGVVLRREEKLAIARQLDEVGVDRIEAGMPAVSEEDFAAIRDISRAGLNAKVVAFVRAMVKDVEMCLRAGVQGVVIEVPAGYMRLKHQYGWTEADVIKRSVEAVAFAKKEGLEVVFFPFDATRADPRFYEELVKTVYEAARPDSVCVVDTLGCALPQSMAWQVRRLRTLLDCPIEVHTHNDFGLGVAGSLAAVSAGAEVVHVCVNGMGERTGNAALEEVALALRILYDMELGIEFGRLQDVSKLVQQLTGVKMPNSKPVVGPYAFGREVGLGMDMVKKQPRTVFPCVPTFVGQQPTVVLGKKSGIQSIAMKLEEWELAASEAQMREMLDGVKRLATENKRPVSDEEMRSIYEEVIHS